jgi:hypothetical protein
MKKTKTKSNKKKEFLFTITATQEFDIYWDVEAASEEEALKQIKKKFKGFVINSQWSSSSLQDSKGLSSHWTPIENATIAVSLLEEYENGKRVKK